MPIISYGIACCRKANNKYELLMIKKKNTYAFIDFVRGNYDVNKKYNIINLFDKMTIDEKIWIKCNNFTSLWFKCYNEQFNKSNNPFYNRGYKKYNLLININNGKYLNELIILSKNYDLIYEPPKGRKNKNEFILDTAIREFYEETNIDKTKYKLLLNEKPINYSFIDMGVRYTYIYYLAIMKNNNYTPKFTFNSEHMTGEISDIKFLSTDYIKLLNNNKMYNLSKYIISKIKKYN